MEEAKLADYQRLFGASVDDEKVPNIRRYVLCPCSESVFIKHFYLACVTLSNLYPHLSAVISYQFHSPFIPWHSVEEFAQFIRNLNDFQNYYGVELPEDIDEWTLNELDYFLSSRSDWHEVSSDPRFSHVSQKIKFK